MPGCDRYVLLMSEKLDGPLREREERELAHHLEVCPRCRGVWRDFSTFSDVLRQTPEEEPPETLKESILSAVNALPAEGTEKPEPEEKPRRARRAPWRRWAAAAAAAAVILGGTLTAWKTGWLPGGSFGQTASQEEKPMEYAAPLPQSDSAKIVPVTEEPVVESGAEDAMLVQAPMEEEPRLPDESTVTGMLLCYHIDALPEEPEYLIPEGEGSWLCPAEHLGALQDILKDHAVVTAWEARSGYTGVSGEYVRITLVP